MESASKIQEKILQRLKKVEFPPKKQFVLALDAEVSDQLDQIARALTKSSGRSTTRNALIEEAIELYIEEALATLEQQGVSLGGTEAAEQLFDTVVFSAPEDAFKQMFLKEHAWKNVRINAAKIPYIRYVAVYISKPVSRITHYAKVNPQSFELDGESGRYTLRLEGEPVALENPVPLGSTPPAAARSPLYTTLQRLLAAREIIDLK